MNTRSRKTNVNWPLKLAIVASRQAQVVIAQRAGIGEVRLSLIVTLRAEARPDERRALAKVLRRPIAELFPSADDEKAAAL